MNLNNMEEKLKKKYPFIFKSKNEINYLINDLIKDIEKKERNLIISVLNKYPDLKELTCTLDAKRIRIYKIKNKIILTIYPLKWKIEEKNKKFNYIVTFDYKEG